MLPCGNCVHVGVFRWVCAFKRSVFFVVEWEDNNVMYITYHFLCLVVWMLLKVVFVHMERRWKHV